MDHNLLASYVEPRHQIQLLGKKHDLSIDAVITALQAGVSAAEICSALEQIRQDTADSLTALQLALVLQARQPRRP